MLATILFVIVAAAVVLILCVEIAGISNTRWWQVLLIGLLLVWLLH